jgi:coenzyme PQQ precursor peptide PqqA
MRQSGFLATNTFPHSDTNSRSHRRASLMFAARQGFHTRPLSITDTGGRMAGTAKTRRRWVRPKATQVRLGAEVTSYAGLDPLRA